MTDRLTETQVSTTLIHDGRVVHLSVDEVKLPNGAISKKEIVRHNGAVAIVPFDAEGRVIIVRQWRYAAGRALLEIPAGTLNPGEDPDECAIRELQEETGFKPGRLKRIGGIFVAPGYSTEFIHLYTAHDLTESRLEADDDEFIEVLHLSLADVIKRIATGEIADGKTISAVLLAKELQA